MELNERHRRDVLVTIRWIADAPVFQFNYSHVCVESSAATRWKQHHSDWSFFQRQLFSFKFKKKMAKHPFAIQRDILYSFIIAVLDFHFKWKPFGIISSIAKTNAPFWFHSDICWQCQLSTPPPSDRISIANYVIVYNREAIEQSTQSQKRIPCKLTERCLFWLHQLTDRSIDRMALSGWIDR